MPPALSTLESFYAHALAIEREAAERYREFEAYFADRSEAVLAAICGMLAGMEEEHYASLVQAAAGLALPAVERGYAWSAEPGGESAPRKDFYRIVNGEQLLEIALEGEIRAQRFFAWVAETSPEPTVRSIAQSMAEEESRHIRWVTRALSFHNPLRA